MGILKCIKTTNYREKGDNLQCRNCPYIKDDLDRMINEYYEYPGSTLTEYEISEFLHRYCWCEKVGGKIWHYGDCGDIEHSINNRKSSSKRKRRNKRERDLKYKRYLKRLSETSGGFPSGAFYTDEVWIRGQGYVHNEKPYYKRLYRSKRSKYLKKQSHRKIRRYKGELHNGCMCNRLYDFWWELC